MLNDISGFCGFIIFQSDPSTLDFIVWEIPSIWIFEHLLINFIYVFVCWLSGCMCAFDFSWTYKDGPTPVLCHNLVHLVMSYD